MPREKRAPEHYVNNKEFTQAVIDHVAEVNEARKKGVEEPQVPNYVAECLLRMAEGLSHKSNFVRYTFREEMVMDAVENMLRVLDKATFDANASTRKGPPNAFGYFTNIAWYAFIRRITKENKQYELKMKYIAEQNLDEFMVDPDEDPEVARAVQSFVDNLRRRIDDVKEKDQKFNTYKKAKLTNKRKGSDSDLMEFLED